MGRRDYIFLIAILALGWAFWLWRLGVADYDDMLSNELMFARQSVSAIVLHNPWPDQSPLYFLLLHGLRKISESTFFIQFVNAVLLTLTLAATYAFGLACSGSRAVASAAILLGAVSPTSLWLVRNGRMYSLQVLFSVLAPLFLLRYLERRRRGDLIAVAALSVLNIYVHFVGFLITALLFVPLLVDAALDVRREMRADRSIRAWRPFIPPALAAAAVLVLVLPQLVRFASLIGGGVPFRAEVSLPGLSTTFLDRVSRFWFVNADWGALRAADRAVTGLYVGSIAVLIAAGMFAVRRRTGAIVASWILVPLVGIGLVAARMDVRDRYFVWTVPLLWIAVATGAFGALPSRRLTGAGAEIARGMRAALALAVAVGSIWLLFNKLSEPSPQWTKLMTALGGLYRPSMVVYMPPSSTMGTPRLLADQMGLASGLQDIRVLDEGTHARFIGEVDRGQDFVFIVYGPYSNAELAWRSHYLEAHDYHRAMLPVIGAHAEIYTRGDVGGFSQTRQLAGEPTPENIVAWTRQQLRQRPHATARAPVLGDALVARVHGDGVIREGRLFASQRGENGTWRLGPVEWDAVEEVRTTSGAVERDVIAAHPDQHSVLVVAFPAIGMKKSVRLTYGIADSGLAFRPGANVNVTLYVNGTRTIEASCPNTPGWKELAADTAGLDGVAADVVMLITTPDDRSRHFAFRLESSSRAAATALDATPGAAPPVVLTGGRTLKDAVDRLRVFRIEDDRRIDARSEPHAYSAADMHEQAAAAGEGAVQRQWVLGAPLWDAVGVTRQRSGGEARDGLWAHPRNGTTLVIEAPGAKTGELLHGYAGLTDYAVMQATGLNVNAPVRFRILVDGRLAFEGEAPRRRGWTGFAVPVGGATGGHDLRIEIACASDSWAHFVFDLGGS